MSMFCSARREMFERTPIMLLMRVTALAGLYAGLAACDPCFGVGNCNGPPRVAIEGTFVGHAVGSAVAGVRGMSFGRVASSW